MYQESTLIDLVKLIYDAAADSARWPAFLGRYQEILAARNIALGYTSPDLSQSLFLATGVDMSDMERYHRYPCPWLDRLLMANWRDGGADASHHLISDSELRSTDCFNEFLGPRQFHYGMGAAIPATQEGPAVLVILRENHKGPYSDEDLHFLRTLLPHMSSAFNLYVQLAHVEAGRKALASSLDRLSTGLILLSASGRILFANRVASGIAALNDGLRFSREGLTAALPLETTALRRIISSAARTTNGKGHAPGGAILLSRPSMRRSLALTISPLSQEPLMAGLADSPAVAVFVTDPESSTDADAALLSRLYGLTPAESRLAGELLEGRDLRAAAEELGVSYHTARAQSKSIFGKTGTRGQTDLLRLLLKLPAAR